MVAGTFLNPSIVSGGTITSYDGGYVSGLDSSNFYNTDNIEKRENYYETKESYNVANTGRDAVIETKISNIITLLEKGHSDKAMQEYNKLLEQMSKQTRYSQLYEEGDDSQLRAIAQRLLENEVQSQGKYDSLQQCIEKNNETTFERGFWFNWDGDSLTEEDLLKEMCDYDAETVFTSMGKGTGKVVKAASTTAIGAGIGAVLGFGPVGAAIGAGIGAGVGILMDIISK